MKASLGSHLTKGLLGIILFFSFNHALMGQGKEVIRLEDSQKSIRIGKQLYYYEDESQLLGIEEVSRLMFSNNFTQSTTLVPNFGKSPHAFWIRFTVTAQETSKPWFLELAYPTFDTVEFYFKNDRQIWEKVETGDVFPFDQRPFNHRNFVFELPLSKNVTKDFYLRVHTRGSVMFPMKVATMDQLNQEQNQEEIQFGLFYGIMLVMLFYNLFLFFSSRLRSYLFYCLIICGNLLALSALNGHSFQYLWPQWPWWGNQVLPIAIGLWVFASNFFARDFLESYKANKNFNRFFLFFGFTGAALIFVSLVVDYKLALHLANMLLPINCLFLLISGLYFWVKGYSIARIYTLAWSLYLLGVVMYNFRNLGVLPVNFITSHIMEIGAIMEVVLLSMAIGVKYRNLEKERNHYQKEALDALSDKQRIIEDQNLNLEKNIQQRTLEIQQKQKEIIKQNRELLQQKEELGNKNKELMEAQHIIEKQNTKLTHYKDDLEREVERRTAQLEIANKELIENIQKLEQYAYLTAHNLRAPVARLLGLTSLLDNHSDGFNDENSIAIIEKIKNSGVELDRVIRDINQMIEIKKSSSQALKMVSLEEYLLKVLQLLHDQVLESEAKIQYDFKEADQIRAIPVYVESIFYNLVSNAIKYKHPDRNLDLRLSSYIQNQFVVVEVKDNGIGIDMERFGKNLFGIYKRFHDHVEGKGLGLYLVKTQMELSGGSIGVQSTPNKGTTFKLFFKKPKTVKLSEDE